MRTSTAKSFCCSITARNVLARPAEYGSRRYEICYLSTPYVKASCLYRLFSKSCPHLPIPPVFLPHVHPSHPPRIGSVNLLTTLTGRQRTQFRPTEKKKERGGKKRKLPQCPLRLAGSAGKKVNVHQLPDTVVCLLGLGAVLPFLSSFPCQHRSDAGPAETVACHIGRQSRFNFCVLFFNSRGAHLCGSQDRDKKT
jgi:hypothetical protein